MQRRAKSDAPGTYDETDVLTSPSSFDTSVPVNSNSNSNSKSNTSPNKRGKGNNKPSGVKIVMIPVAIFLVVLLLLDKFTPTPNLLLPNNEKRTAVPSHKAPASASASLAPTKAKLKSKVNAVTVEPKATTLAPPTESAPREATESKTESEEPETKESTSTQTATSIGSGSDVKYHIIFSTSCSTFQDWQSYVFFHEALVSNQPGTVTRIVSGCKEEDEMAARTVFQEQIEPMAPGRFKIHFTPDFSHVKEGVSFPYFNKPFGTKHWLEHAMGYPVNPVDEDSIVVLMDPDQLILRPFENNDFSNERWVHLKKGQVPRTRIEHGQPMGQLYGFGLQWKTKVNMTHISPNEHSPVDDLTNKEAMAGYVLGPPYIATARDMYTIAVKWCEFGPRVYDTYPHLLAEMFAYSLAAAHTKLPHQTAASFMVSDVGVGPQAEGWGDIDNLHKDQVCAKHSPKDLPHVIHFCQRYGLGDYFFGKRRLPKNFLSCESPLLAEAPPDIVGNYLYANWPDGKRKDFNAKMAQRNGFVLCYMLPAINEAATYFKARHCTPETANLKKTLFVNQV